MKVFKKNRFVHQKKNQKKTQAFIRLGSWYREFVKREKHNISVEEKKKKQKDLVTMVTILVVFSFLTFIESRLIHFGETFPVSSTILMFILININLLMLFFLIILVFRNLAKILYDRSRKVMGTRLRTRLIVAFISISLLPTAVLFLFSINFITKSIDLWFNVPIENTLENALSVGRVFYTAQESRNRFFIMRMKYQIKIRNLLDPQNKEELRNYLGVAQKEFRMDAVEVYRISSGKNNRESETGSTYWESPHAGSSADGLEVERMLFFATEELKRLLHPVSKENLVIAHERRKKRQVKPNEAGFQRETDKSVRTITEKVGMGEVVRSLSPAREINSAVSAKYYLAVTSRIPSGLSHRLKSINRGYEEYRQVKLLKRPIQITFYIIISIVALIVLFCAVWFGIYMARFISIPIMELSEGTKKVAEGDLSFTIPPASDDEIGTLVDSFNKMTKDLRTSRNQLELSTKMLKDQNTEIEKRRKYMEIVLKNVSGGVITLDARGFVTTVNKSAEKMLGLSSEEILDKNYRKFVIGEYKEMASEILDKLNRQSNDAIEFPLRITIHGRPKSFMMHVNVLRDESGHNMGLVIVFDDLTELEKAQRMAAWREVARRIAHEVKNPLTPIKLSAQRLTRKFSGMVDDPVFEECTRTIVEHVDLIRNLVNEFSTFARFPSADPRPTDIRQLLLETVDLYREGHKEVVFSLELDEDAPLLHIDPRQMKQAMMNLLNNAVSAIREKGNIHISLTQPGHSRVVRVVVADDGPGISDKDKVKLFEPYFSTKKSGMGLGLTIVSTIISDHHGSIHAEDNHPKGAKFVIELPV